MAINLRRVGEVADGSVTADKLAVGAVDLDSNKVTGQLPTDKLKDGAVIEDKIDDLAISTGKLKDAAVTLAKSHDDIRLSTYIGDETEVSVTGTTEEVVKEFSIPKKVNKLDPIKLRFIASVKTNDALYTATIKIYIDSEVDPRGEATSTSTDYELLDMEFSIDDLPKTKHMVKIALVSDNVLGIAYNDMIDAMVVK